MTSDEPAAGGVRMVSSVPGRIRLRSVGPGGRQRLSSVAGLLGAWSEVTSVDVRSRAASVVVRFDPAEASVVADRLVELGVEMPAGARPESQAAPAAAVGAAAAWANRSVGQRLEGTDLRVLVPLGLGLMAARRAMRGDDRLADAPWYVLAWYASETFTKFQGRPVPPGRTRGEET